MTSVAGTFIVSLAASIALTPAVRELARWWRIVDEPTARKVHAEVTPRAGGVAIYVAFMLAFLGALVWDAGTLQAIDLTRKTLALLVGGSVVFVLGLWDDVRSLPPTRKLVGQVVAALIAYLGGIEIVKVTVPGFEQVVLGWLAGPATILWFVLIVNALNLIDGLDGLATGISLFTALVLLIVLDSSSHFLVMRP